MKNIVLGLFALLILVSCNDTKEEKQAILPISNGKINNVSIIIDDNLWAGEIGDSLRKKFASPVDGLPNEEPIFTINQYPIKIFNGFVRKSRNVIVVQKGPKTGYAFNKNEFAKPQNVHYISGEKTIDVLTVLESKYQAIVKQIKTAEIKERQRRIAKSPASDKQVRDRFGISLNLPFGYKYDMVKDNFLWIRREFSSGYNSVLVYEVPLEAFSNKEFPVSDVIKMRDSIGKENIQGTLTNTWMVTEAAYAPYIFTDTIKGRFTYETKGTWELKNDFMVGPFINYVIKDVRNNRYLVLEGFTYNPSKSKRDLVFELEAIIRSVKFLK